MTAEMSVQVISNIGCWNVWHWNSCRVHPCKSIVLLVCRNHRIMSKEQCTIGSVANVTFRRDTCRVHSEMYLFLAVFVQIHSMCVHAKHVFLPPLLAASALNVETCPTMPHYGSNFQTYGTVLPNPPPLPACIKPWLIEIASASCATSVCIMFISVE